MSSPPGLSTAEAARRLAESGPNELQRAEGTPIWRLLLTQFTNPLVALLLVACVVAGLLGDVVDAIAIGAIVLLNGLVGFWQEFSAQNAVLALRSMTAPRARVVRDGASVILMAREVVPGDVLLLEAGDLVAADARVLDAHGLLANEAALTGESLPVEKSTAPTAEGTPLAERTDRVFLGTAITAGSAAVEVVATGPRTELGRIAHLLATAEDTATPLQRDLERVGASLLRLCLIIVAVIAALGLARGEALFDVVMNAIPLAVAAVPEGLPAVVTIALALGVQRMAARNVLVRKLPAVETLGSATVICTDKTGTLTTGEMTVREMWAPDHDAMLDAAVACCDAELHADGTAVGDTTEVALLRAGFAHGVDRAAIEQQRPRVAVHPFDSERKRMSVLRADGVLYVKGAPDLLLPLCTAGQEGAALANTELASAGLRVLAVAVGRGSEERELTLMGLVGIADPPRTEAIHAVRVARAAGIQTVMITGDHPATALAIAREMGIVLPGEDPSERVHARVTPEDKLRIVRGFKARGAIVAMTGDGVNDAPALREAHIGIAMGQAGTEVTREAADMVLADDDFASIVAAIREGRGIWENIRKSVIYLLAGNSGELMVMLGASLAGLPMPLLPLQLLWINLVTDGLPALALVMDPAPDDVLNRPPRRPDQPMLDRSAWLSAVGTGAMEAAIALTVFAWALPELAEDHARTMVFMFIVFSQMLRAFAARSETKTLWQVGAGSNLRLVGVVAFTTTLQIVLLQVPAARELLHLTAIPQHDLLLVAALGFGPVTVLEGIKILRFLLRRG